MNDDNPQTLKDVARAALDNNRGMTGRELDREAKRKGLKIVYTTINHMAAGTYKSRPSKSTLEALAQLSGFTLEQVYDAAKLPMPMRPLAADLPPDADLLTGAQRRLVVDTVRLFAQQNRALHELEERSREAGSGRGQSPDEKSDGDGGATVTELSTPPAIEEESPVVEEAARPGDEENGPPRGTSTKP